LGKVNRKRKVKKIKLFLYEPLDWFEMYSPWFEAKIGVFNENHGEK